MRNTVLRRLMLSLPFQNGSNPWAQVVPRHLTWSSVRVRERRGSAPVEPGSGRRASLIRRQVDPAVVVSWWVPRVLVVLKGPPKGNDHFAGALKTASVRVPLCWWFQRGPPNGNPHFVCPPKRNTKRKPPF